jgi:hypothetical protein
MHELKEMDDILNKIKKLVAKCKKSTLMADQLRDLNKFLTKNNSTRWNSDYMMINGYLKLSSADLKALLSFNSKKKNLENQKKLILANVEVEKIKELQSIYKELYICTQILQGDNVTISKLLPAIRTIKFNLKNLKLKYLNGMVTPLLESK